MIVINFKTYKEGTGIRALKLAKLCEKVAKATKTKIIITAQTADIRLLTKNVSIPIYAQHIDDVNYGANTGSSLAEAVKEAGAIGTLLNHSEKQLTISQLEQCINKAKKLELKTIVCASDAKISGSLFRLSPDYIAVEPPELISGRISVSTANPKLIRNAVRNVCGTKKCNNVLVGAGIKTGKDVAIAKQLGANGVLVASGVVKSPNPLRALKDLIGGLKNVQ